MQSDSQQWHLFGLDLSRAARFLQAGWRELLWGDTAGLRARLDSPVELLREDGTRQLYVAERPLAAAAVANGARVFHALQFPSSKVLFRTLRLPKVLELELQEAIALEVRTHSPFPAENTAHGWLLGMRGDDWFEVSLAIAARSEVFVWLNKEARRHTPGVPEIWVKDDAGRNLVLQGFGEQQRYKAYPQRVAAMGARLAFVVFCLLALMALPGLVRSLQSSRMEDYFDIAQQEAAQAQALREALILGNTRVEELQAVHSESPDYHALLEHVSALTPDDIYVQTMSIEGAQLRLMGLAKDAIAYMQLLEQDPMFAEVRTPSAFNQDRRTGLERFVFDIRVALPTAGESP